MSGRPSAGVGRATDQLTVNVPLLDLVAQYRTIKADVDRMEEEIDDRFGPLPLPVKDLLRAARVRALARDLGVTRISAGPEAVALDMEPDSEDRHDEAVEASDGELEWVGDRLVRRQPTETPEARMDLVLEMLEELA